MCWCVCFSTFCVHKIRFFLFLLSQKKKTIAYTLLDHLQNFTDPFTLTKFPERPTSHFTKKFPLRERLWHYQAYTHWSALTQKHTCTDIYKQHARPCATVCLTDPLHITKVSTASNEPLYENKISSSRKIVALPSRHTLEHIHSQTQFKNSKLEYIENSTCYETLWRLRK